MQTFALYNSFFNFAILNSIIFMLKTDGSLNLSQKNMSVYRFVITLYNIINKTNRILFSVMH
jgi:hypothetical protein